ncbi:hypothetical protein AB0F52_44795, partial [Amycolatopsis sp. NPDC024027]
MSILAERGHVRPATPVPAPLRPVRVLRGRRGEVHRPPTRARVVAGRRPAGAPRAAPRRGPLRRPGLAGRAVASCRGVSG